MKCTNSNCGHEIPEGVKFCNRCGTKAPAAQKCRSCGTMNLAEAKFCKSCSKSLAEVSGTGGALSDVNSMGEFVYELPYEQLETEGKKKFEKPQPSIGLFAFSCVNGVVKEAKAVKPKEKAETTEPETFWGTIKRTVTGLFESLSSNSKEDKERVKKSTKVFLMLDFRNSPLLSHVKKIPLVGLPDANLRFEFWVNPEAEGGNLTLFKDRVLGTKAALSCLELKEFAIAFVEQHILPAFKLEALPSDPASAALIGKELEKLTGISANCIFNRGKLGERHYLEVGKSKITCPHCHKTLKKISNFCGHCAADISKVDWDTSITYLQAAGGEQLTLRLSMLIDRSLSPLGVGEEPPQIEVSDDKVNEEVLRILGPILRRYDVPSLMKSVMLTQLSNELNNKLAQDWRGYITELNVVDLRTAQEEWFFKTEALLAEQLRNIEADKKFLAIEQSEIELQEAAFALVMRRIAQGDSEELTQRRQEAAKKRQLADLEVGDHALDTETNLRKAIITDDAEKELLAREKDKAARERDYLREQTNADREDQVSHIDHDITLEKKAAQHDIDLADMTGEAASRAKRRDISDDLFRDEEEIRIAAKAEEQLGHIKEDLEDRKEKRQIDKLTALAELDAKMAQQEHEHELSKKKEDNALERDKIDAMKNLDAVQILAMQAAELAKASGGGQASADMIKSIASSHAETAKAQAELQTGSKVAEAQAAAAQAAANMQAQMYERMLQNQKESAAMAIDAHKSAASAIQSTTDKSMDSMRDVAQASSSEANAGYKEAARISQSVNEKSMDSMSKVATAAAAHSNDGLKEAVQVSRSVNETSIESMAEVYSAALKHAQYKCGNCSHQLQDDDMCCTECGTPRKK